MTVFFQRHNQWAGFFSNITEKLFPLDWHAWNASDQTGMKTGKLPRATGLPSEKNMVWTQLCMALSFCQLLKGGNGVDFGLAQSKLVTVGPKEYWKTILSNSEIRDPSQKEVGAFRWSAEQEWHLAHLPRPLLLQMLRRLGVATEGLRMNKRSPQRFLREKILSNFLVK